MATARPQATRLDRKEHIRQEMARAAEYGMVPRNPISVARNFRMEALVRSGNRPLPGLVVAGAARAIGAVPRVRKNGWKLPDPKVAQAAVEDALGRLNGANRTKLIPELLAHYGDLAAQAKPGHPFGDLQKKVFAAAFGEQRAAVAQGGDARKRRKS